MPFILKGFLINLVMSALAMVLGTVLGTGLGLLELSHVAAIRKPAYFVMNVFRNTPWLVILFIAMYVFPFEFTWINGEIVPIPGWIPATISFAIAIMPDIAEVLRGAINSIPKAQWESASSLGLSRWQTLRVIILPQCVRRMIPPWMNWYAILAMATPLASILGVNESLRNTSIAMEAAGSRPEYLIPFYLFLLILFFAYIYPISLLTRRLEKKYGFIS
jgi:polar amino acid transport system permease protein